MKYFKIYLLLVLILGCSTVKKHGYYSKDLIQVLKLISNNKVFHKTIVKDLDKEINSFVKPSLLEFDLCDQNVAPEIVKLSNKEILYLRDNFKNLKEVRLEKVLKSFKKFTYDKKNNDTQFISYPVFFRNNTMAIYYTYTSFGGGFNLLQKKNSNWHKICSNSIWIE